MNSTTEIIVKKLGEKLIKTEELNETFAELISLATEELKSYPTFIEPRLFYFETFHDKTGMGRIDILKITQRVNSEDKIKDIFMRAGRNIFKKRMVPAAMFMATEMNYFPSKENVIAISGLTIDGRSCLCLIKIKRDDENRIVKHRKMYIRKSDGKISKEKNIILDTIFNGFIEACELTGVKNLSNCHEKITC